MRFILNFLKIYFINSVFFHLFLPCLAFCWLHLSFWIGSTFSLFKLFFWFYLLGFPLVPRFINFICSCFLSGLRYRVRWARCLGHKHFRSLSWSPASAGCRVGTYMILLLWILHPRCLACLTLVLALLLHFLISDLHCKLVSVSDGLHLFKFLSFCSALCIVLGLGNIKGPKRPLLSPRLFLQIYSFSSLVPFPPFCLNPAFLYHGTLLTITSCSS